MPPKRISDHHRLARHCTKKDFADDRMTELGGGAYATSATDLELSVNWLEYYGGDNQAQLAAICEDMSSYRTVRKTHKIGILPLKTIKQIGEECRALLSAKPDPMPPGNMSHALILGISPSERILHQSLADAASENLYNGVSPKKS